MFQDMEPVNILLVADIILNTQKFFSSISTCLFVNITNHNTIESEKTKREKFGSFPESYGKRE